MPKVSILGVDVDDVGKAELEGAIIRAVEGKRKEVFAYVNVHAINLARTDQAFRGFLNNAALAYCDGEGVRFGARVLGSELPPRIVLTRWIWDLGELFQEKGFSAYLLGGAPATVTAAAAKFRACYPRLHLAGCHHGYFDREGHENTMVLDSIRSASPNVLFVGFGMPGQERWIERHLNHLCANAIIPCGGMIDYLSGEVPVAPGWMTENGLEWLYRLLRDPARLWSRYVMGNPAFMLRVFRERLLEGRRG